MLSYEKGGGRLEELEIIFGDWSHVSRGCFGLWSLRNDWRDGLGGCDVIDSGCFIRGIFCLTVARYSSIWTRC